jgi:hypothetical protein
MGVFVAKLFCVAIAVNPNKLKVTTANMTMLLVSLHTFALRLRYCSTRYWDRNSKKNPTTNAGEI